MIVKEKLSLIEEIRSVLKNENIREYMDEHANGLQHRLTPMIIGLFLENTDRKAVDTWLYQMGEDRMNPRNPYEAIFLFVFEKYPNCSGKEKAERWQSLYNEYNERIKDSIVRKEFSPIITFGDLCESLKRDSDEGTSETNTYATKNYTNSVIYPELENAINNTSDTDVVAFGKYLDFLQNDPSIASYQRKATYYLRKFLYESIMSGIYLLYDRHQYAYTKEDNKKTRKAAFSSDESFNAFISYNGICLEGIKNPKKFHCFNTLRSLLEYNGKADKIMIDYHTCKNWLFDKKISYGILSSSFYTLFGNYHKKPIEYVILENTFLKEENRIRELSYDEYCLVRNAFVSEKPDMPIIEYGTPYLPDEDTTDTPGFLAKKHLEYVEKNNRNSYNSLIENMVSGKINISRRLLLLFGVYAGYDKVSLNSILEKSGFEILTSNTTFDRTISRLLETDYIRKHKKLYNNEKFLRKSSSFDTYFSKAKNTDGELDYQTKEEYKEEINDIKEEYLWSLSEEFYMIENDSSLPSVSEILLNEDLRNIMKKEASGLKDVNKLILKK